MRSADAQAATGHQLDLHDIPSTHVVQGLQDEHLLTTVLMEQGAQSEAEGIQRSLDTGLHQSGEMYAMKSSPDQGFTGYNFKHGQDMMVHTDLDGVPVDHPVELVPIQVVPSQGLSVGQGMVAMDGLQVPGSYRMSDLDGGSGYPLSCSQSQGQQYGGQPQGFLSAPENSMRQVCQTPTRVDAHGRPTKVLVQRGGSGTQHGMQVQRPVRRVSRTLSDSEIVMESSLVGRLSSGAIGHHVFGGVVHAGGLVGTPPVTENGERCGGIGGGGKEGAKTRWKPNPVQLCLLEQHFNSGECLASHELALLLLGWCNKQLTF